ncbi:MAG: DUF2155 domain-containing protein [Magnetococcus sp. MYC-9]
MLRPSSLFLLRGLLSVCCAGGAGRVALWACVVLLAGCQPEQKQEPAYLSLEVRDRDRLPLAPHALVSRARPTAAMTADHTGASLRFMILDKRTLKILRLVAPVGQRSHTPWGVLYPVAFAPDLIIREGLAVHGPEGYFNPAVWVLLEDANGQPLHEGWLFARDSAQTAWDHPRYDVTFLGMAETAVVDPKGAVAGGGTAPGAATTATRKRIPSSPVAVPEPQDEVADGGRELPDQD